MEIVRPELSIVLSGTPEAAKQMVSTTSDGLLSRLCMFTFDSPLAWQSQRPSSQTRSRDEGFASAGETMHQLNRILADRSTPLIVNMTVQQWDTHDRTFKAMLHQLAMSDADASLNAVVKRLGKTALRIAAICAVLRAHDAGANLATVPHLQTTDADASIGIALARSYYIHAVDFAKTLAKCSGPRLSADERSVLNSIPVGVEMRSTDVVDLITATGVVRRTANRWISHWTSDGILVKVRRGVYIRPRCHNDTIDTLERAPILDGDDSDVSDIGDNGDNRTRPT